MFKYFLWWSNSYSIELTFFCHLFTSNVHTFKLKASLPESVRRRRYFVFWVFYFFLYFCIFIILILQNFLLFLFFNFLLSLHFFHFPQTKNYSSRSAQIYLSLSNSSKTHFYSIRVSWLEGSKCSPLPSLSERPRIIHIIKRMYNKYITYDIIKTIIRYV